MYVLTTGVIFICDWAQLQGKLRTAGVYQAEEKDESKMTTSGERSIEKK